MSNIKSMTEKSGDARHTDVKQTLENAIKEFTDGKLKDYKNVLVLALDDDDEKYNTRFMQAGMSMSQCLALCEVAKTMFLTEMEYI